ncbi:multiple sugar transport system permease protein [Microbacteriaceae bacterium SG_E_30_P1]|uniref:Multiple sugar transport system permease protein n=1 Tax=Antiquaquibacter oligotrophicus TaxID=2880260 RepID=A0ABT6KNY7_9MICO|nr:carbohydrate ABC transporter permease [Antiquaquibacter oligotrophicus]MDH6181709.1 multiple sugar transport system permease protein [Antiquaquibacter oligotrophicus]UDF12608.1 carbohydrate ABC transporter permease [Antiquaquibacter oligotrophicus]
MIDRSAARHRSALSYTVLAIALVVTLVPLLYLFSLSLMGRDETVSGILWTSSPKWSNWAEVIGTVIPLSIGNSLLAALGGAALTLVFALPGAWAIARFRAGGRTLGATLMSPWLLPPIVAVVPLLTLLRIVGLNNTLPGLAIVYALANVPVAVWLLEGFVRRLPKELEEAATIDGAGSWRTLVSVIAPLLAPSLVAVGIIVAILNYNEFLLATFLTQSADTQTFPVALSLFYGDRTPHFGKIAAASFIGVIPVFAAAVFFQRWLVSGLTAGAVR